MDLGNKPQNGERHQELRSELHLASLEAWFGWNLWIKGDVGG